MKQIHFIQLPFNAWHCVGEWEERPHIKTKKELGDWNSLAGVTNPLRYHPWAGGGFFSLHSEVSQSCSCCGESPWLNICARQVRLLPMTKPLLEMAKPGVSRSNCPRGKSLVAEMDKVPLRAGSHWSTALPSLSQQSWWKSFLLLSFQRSCQKQTLHLPCNEIPWSLYSSPQPPAKSAITVSTQKGPGSELSLPLKQPLI